MELARYYSHLVTLGWRNTPTMVEAQRDLLTRDSLPAFARLHIV